MSIQSTIKRGIKNLIYRPLHVDMGDNSYVRWPRNISGANHIRMGQNSIVLENCHFEAITRYRDMTYKPSIIIGDGVYVGRYAFFTAVHRIQIGNGCVLSDHVYITDESHGLDPEGVPIMEQPLVSKGPVQIGERCFLGYRTAIMPGVSLGDGCVVGANSTVTRPFPAYSMVAGSPARLIKTFSAERKRWETWNKA